MSDMTIVYNFNYVRCDEGNDFENATYDEGYKPEMSDTTIVYNFNYVRCDEDNDFENVT